MERKNSLSPSVDKMALALTLPYLIPVMLGVQVAVFWLSKEVGFFPGADVFSGILSSCAEIIAGLYGITMASYTFFLSRMDSITASDGTLDYVLRSIKNRFKHLIWYISGNVLMTLMISIILMYAPAPVEGEASYFYRLFCNEFILFVAFSIGLILYYAILVIDPNCIEKEAARLKKRLGGRKKLSGSTVEFIGLYDRIEEVCNSMLPPAVLHQLHENKGKHFELTLELLREQNLVLLPLLQELVRVHRYYECVVNCSPMTVSQEMCLAARRALTCLEELQGSRLVRK